MKDNIDLLDAKSCIEGQQKLLDKNNKTRYFQAGDKLEEGRKETKNKLVVTINKAKASLCVDDNSIATIEDGITSKK